MTKLTNKQKLFVREYLVDLNATQAAIRAGYAKKAAYSMGAENLRKPQIRDAIEKANQKRFQHVEITAENVLRELGLLGFSNVQKMFTESGHLRDIASLEPEVAAAIQSVEVVVKPTGEQDADGNKVVEHVHKIRMTDKKGPLELLGRHLVLFTDKVEHGGGLQITKVVREIVESENTDS